MVLDEAYLFLLGRLRLISRVAGRHYLDTRCCHLRLLAWPTLGNTLVSTRKYGVVAPSSSQRLE